MAPMQPIPTPEPASLRKGLSWPDVQALGLVLMILMVINLPLYQSVLQEQGKEHPTRIAGGHAVPLPLRTAFAKTLSTDSFQPGVSSLTKASGASNRNLTR